MTLKRAGSHAGWITLAAALLSGAARAAVPAADAQFFLTANAAVAISASEVVAQKAAAAKAITDMKGAAASAAEDEQFPDGRGWSPTFSVQSAAPSILAARVSPDSSFTPGHLCTSSDPNFKEYRYAEHIPYCNRMVTFQMKTDIAAHYGVLQSAWSGFEFDHLIPLAIGGDSSVDNIWPQPHAPGSPDGSEGKDKLEEQLYLQMKAGSITQADAVKQIYDWFTVSDMARKIIQVSSR
ncbi:MAG: hypothetical protein KGJ84_11855 [Elusimicrobia bacterium]|nr:hypothetical protein [Elusimicrobiota bacterium]